MNHLRAECISDVLEAYRKVAPTCFTQAAAWHKVVKMPAPRFYIEEETAYKNLLDIKRGRMTVKDFKLESTQRMYAELLERVNKLSMQPDMAGVSFRRLVSIVVLQPAPEFYLTPDTVRNMVTYGRKTFSKKLAYENRQKPTTDNDGQDITT